MALVFLRCFNPFAPATGEPDINSFRRATPDGVLQQLVESYQGLRFDLFCDLFGDGKSFKYYVPQSNVDEMDLSNIKAVATLEMIDTSIPFVDSGSFYYYSTFAEEREIHNKLFQAISINFYQPLVSDSIAYTIIPDSTFSSSDSIMHFDTVAAVVRTRQSGLKISDTLFEQESENTEEFTLGKQVFCMVRDPGNQKLWIIVKWFELPNLN
jgi:hypothetical protein